MVTAAKEKRCSPHGIAPFAYADALPCCMLCYVPLLCFHLCCPAESDGLDLLGYVEFQRNYRYFPVYMRHWLDSASSIV
jgi:hypothetical protein